MFKFRRRSICSSKAAEFDILSESNSLTGEASVVADKGDSSSVKKKSVVDSRTLTSSASQSEEKEIEKPGGKSAQSVSSGGSEKTSGFLPGALTKWSINGDKLKANLISHVMYDRKRKERQESISQGQERKVIRCAEDKKSLSDDEGLNDIEKAKDFKRTLSHDNFNPKSEPEFDGGPRKEQQENEGNVFGSTVITVIKNVGSKVDGQEPLVLADQPLVNTLRKFPGSYEPEVQRQLERSMNYSVNIGSKAPRRHRRRHRSSRHDSGGSVADVESANDEQPDEIESPVGSSSSESINETVRSIPLVKIEDSSTANQEDFELELSALHQTEASKPISFLESISASGTNDQVMLSPRSGLDFLIRDAIDLGICPSPPMMQTQLDPPTSRRSLLGGNESTKINSLTHQVTNFKKHLKILEEEYEQVYGYKPSHADKLNNKEMKKCLMQLAKAKRDLKQLKEDPAGVQEANLLSVGKNPFSSHHVRGTPESLKSLDETVTEIEEFLTNKRRTSGRSNEPEDMTSSELIDEKFAMQRQLLLLEKRHGRPCSKQEKDIVRPLYDRYRSVKKFGMRAVNAKDASLDLVPILEHETLEFPEIESEGNSPSCSVVEIKKDFVSPNHHRLRMSHPHLLENDMESDDGEDYERNESFNDMSLPELEKRQKQVKEDKRRLRSVLRKFESEFEERTGRPPSKEEKYCTEDMQNSYFQYKRTRATARLIEVLITKKKYPQLLVDLNKNED